MIAGDSLWRLAEDVVAERLGRAATDVEITPYWQSVVEANRSRLRSGDPDVLFPGESVVLALAVPSPDPAGGHLVDATPAVTR